MTTQVTRSPSGFCGPKGERSSKLALALACFVCAFLPIRDVQSESFDRAFSDFLYERNGVHDGHSADAFFAQLHAIYSESDPTQSLRLNLVACHYIHRDNAEERINIGRQGSVEAVAAGLLIEASQFKLCKGVGHREQGNIKLAKTFMQRAIDLATDAGDRFVEGLSYSALADALGTTGSFGPALTALINAHEAFNEAGRQERAAVLAIDIATIYRRIGHLTAAETMLLHVLDNLDNPNGEDYLDAILQLGLVQTGQGKHEQAISTLRSALEAAVNSGIPSLHRAYHMALAGAYLDLDQPADTLLHASKARDAQYGYSGTAAINLSLLEARALLAQGRHELARQRLSEIDSHIAMADNEALLIDWLATSAEVAGEMGDHETAWALLSQARDLEREAQQRFDSEKMLALQAELTAREERWAQLRAQQESEIGQLRAESASQQRINQALIRSLIFITLLVATAWSITQFQHRRRLGRLVNQDDLTKLLNRRGFFLAAEKVIAKKASSVLMLDLDHFKQVNDRFGHAAGDRVLEKLGRVLAKNSRESDLIARLGGEEFAWLLPGLSLDQAMVAADRLRKQWSETRLEGLPNDFRSTMTIGLASSKEVKDHDLERMLLLADQRLYAGKKNGRNRVVGSDQQQ